MPPPISIRFDEADRADRIKPGSNGLHCRPRFVYYGSERPSNIEENVAPVPQIPLPGLAPSARPPFPPEVSGAIRVFADFVAAARAISDDTSVGREERVRGLRAMEAGLTGKGPDGPAARLHRVLCRTGVGSDHARHILQACHKDVTTNRYRSWSELLAYCRYAAAPIGRFVFDLCGEGQRAKRASDGLFSAWHVLSIIQNCRDDYLGLDRIYLPAAWLRQNGVDPEALGERRSSPQLGKVFANAIDGVWSLIETGRPETATIRDESLRTATDRSFALADRLRIKIARRDPLSSKIEIGRWDQLVTGLRSRGR